jgi:hypothetical protein
LKAFFISSYNSNATFSRFRASVAVFITILIAKFVDLFRLLPICPFGSKCSASAAFVTRRANAASTTLPSEFNNEIGFHAPGVDFCAVVLLGFGSTITFAVLKQQGKYAASKLLIISAASILYNGFPQALSRPAGMLSSSGAFHGFGASKDVLYFVARDPLGYRELVSGELRCRRFQCRRIRGRVRKETLREKA